MIFPSYKRVAEKITGRIGITEVETMLLQEAIGAEGRLHLEIGCLWGATAILAAFSNPQVRVITFDPMEGGFWATGDPAVRVAVSNYAIPPTPKAVLDNFVRFGVAERISIVRCKVENYHFTGDLKPDTMLIDGDHSYGACTHDWKLAETLRPRAVLVHDYKSTKHPGVQLAVDNVAMKSPIYKHIETVDAMALFRLRD